MEGLCGIGGGAWESLGRERRQLKEAEKESGKMKGKKKDSRVQG